MAETKSAKLETRVEGLERELEESRNAIRRLSEQNRSFVTEMAQLRENISRLQAATARLQNTKDLYENTIQRG